MQDLLLQLDYQLFYMINQQWTASWADALFFWLTDLHKSSAFKWFIVPLVLFAFVYKYKKYGLGLFVMMALSIGLSDWTGAFVKRSFKRDRPFNNAEITVVKKSEAGHYSFYSNHASNMMCFAVFASAFFAPLRFGLIVVALLVGYSRVYNGVHYPSDVLFGTIAGATWAFLGVNLAQKTLTYLQNKKVSSLQ